MSDPKEVAKLDPKENEQFDLICPGCVHKLPWLQHYRGMVEEEQASRGFKGLLPVIVHTNSPGLRISYSPVYLFDGKGTIFGSPSTPVQGWIRPGRYIFGGAQGAQPITWDGGEYDVPPALTISLAI